MSRLWGGSVVGNEGRMGQRRPAAGTPAIQCGGWWKGMEFVASFHQRSMLRRYGHVLETAEECLGELDRGF